MCGLGLSYTLFLKDGLTSTELRTAPFLHFWCRKNLLEVTEVPRKWWPGSQSLRCGRGNGAENTQEVPGYKLFFFFFFLHCFIVVQVQWFELTSTPALPPSLP